MKPHETHTVWYTSLQHYQSHVLPCGTPEDCCTTRLWVSYEGLCEGPPSESEFTGHKGISNILLQNIQTHPASLLHGKQIAHSSQRESIQTNMHLNQPQ